MKIEVVSRGEIERIVLEVLRKNLAKEAKAAYRNASKVAGLNAPHLYGEKIEDDVLLTEIDWPLRILGMFANMNINTFGELCSKKRGELEKVRNFGEGSLRHMELILAQYGRKLS